MNVAVPVRRRVRLTCRMKWLDLNFQTENYEVAGFINLQNQLTLGTFHQKIQIVQEGEI
jgi:hypothetical protein